MKIAILYIALGNYIIFWDAFFESAQRFLFPGVHKEFFVFTDHKDFKYSDKNNVHVIPEVSKPWPHASIKRFEFFLKIQKELQKFDYVFFFNANSIFVKTVSNEILPNEKQKITVVRHPFFKVKTFTYDRNPKSTAYIKEDQGEYYVAGGFNGGRVDGFLEMCEELDKNVKIDEKNNVVALWHDESHLNKYILDKKPLILDISFLIPEGLLMANGIKNKSIESIREELRMSKSKIFLIDKRDFFKNRYREPDAAAMKGEREKVQIIYDKLKLASDIL